MKVLRSATVMLGVATLIGSTAIAVAPAEATPGPVTNRITHAGGINVVPTPSGLGLGVVQGDELLVPDCKIGAACAGRQWSGSSGLFATFWSNVGFAPTERLASRWLKDRARIYRESKNFVGNVNVSVKGSQQELTVDGLWVGDPFRKVMIRKGAKMVLVEVLLAPGSSFPASASMKRLERKASEAFGKSWAQVPTTVLPPAPS